MMERCVAVDDLQHLFWRSSRSDSRSLYNESRPADLDLNKLPEVLRVYPDCEIETLAREMWLPMPIAELDLSVFAILPL
jgi:hypothetical protein